METVRFLVGMAAAILFALAGFVASNEEAFGVRLTWIWLSLAVALLVVRSALPDRLKP